MQSKETFVSIQGLPHLHPRHSNIWEVFFCSLWFGIRAISLFHSWCPEGFFSYFYFLFFFYFCSWEGNSIGDFTLLPLRLTFQSNYMSAFNFLPQGNVKGVVSSVPFSSELARSPIKEIFLGGSCQLSHSTGTQGRIFTGEMAQLPGSYHHRLPMLREQTANYPSCRHLHSTWRESRGQWPRTAGRFRERA